MWYSVILLVLSDEVLLCLIFKNVREDAIDTYLFLGCDSQPILTFHYPHDGEFRHFLSRKTQQAERASPLVKSGRSVITLSISRVKILLHFAFFLRGYT